MANIYTAEIQHQGQTYTIPVPDNKTILQAADDAGLQLPTSCGAGVCTTCAALVKAGSVEQSDSMGVSAELQKEGYALLCVAYPRSDLKIVTEKEEEVYQRQFGSQG